MGSGASAAHTAVAGASAAQLQGALADLNEDDLKNVSVGVSANGIEEVAIALAKAPPDQLQNAFALLSTDGQEKLSAALASKEEPAGVGIAIAGENEDNVDAALDLELREQEQLFLKMLRKRAERAERAKIEKEEKKRVKKEQVEKAMEAAFDGEVDELLKLFDAGVEPETADDHGTTLLSEASAGGQMDVLQALLGEGCDPNSIGRYRRTPLWRAAYAGQSELIRALLRAGGDPRETDEQGARPIDVASNDPSREVLVAWDPSSTDRIKKDKAKQAKAKAKAQKEAEKRQEQELSEALEEAERKKQIAKSELARARKLLCDYRQQKVSFAEQGEAAKIAELEPLIEGAEAKVKLYEDSVQEWDWKMSRAKLKQSDLAQAKKEKAAKEAGKFKGFRVEAVCESVEDLQSVLQHLSKDLEVAENFTWGKDKDSIELVKGDAMIKEGQFGHLKKSEFNKNTLSEYGKPMENTDDAPETEGGKKEGEEPLFPLTLAFARGFNRTIPIKSVADVLIKDVGGLRAEDGRWPFVIDPSGRTSTFVKYTGAAVFTMMDLQEMDKDKVRLRSALLKAMLHGTALIIDLGSFETPPDVLSEHFNDIEKGLFSKLLDRSVLYSYLLPRRFKSLINKDVSKEVDISQFLDDAIKKFVFAFVTSFRDPSLDFVKQFYTISVKGGDDEDGDAA